jgi:hypothetical protein
MTEAAAPRPAAGRSADLDVLKTVLVWGMIVAHCIQLLAFRPGPVAQTISTFINLISFSGFMFAFGYGVGLSRRDKSWGQRLWPVLLLLLATWVSEIAFSTLVDRKPLDAELLVPLLSLSRLYGWSEFLASFCVLYLIIAVARPWLVRIATSWPLLVAALLVCAASTWVAISADVPLLATILGTTRFASFPLLAYLPWFLIGIAFGRMTERPGLLDWGLAVVATGAWALWVWHYGGELPGRFPPTVLWVVGAALPILIYVVVSRAIAPVVPRFLLGPGRHVLAALLLSNLAIFTLRWMFGFRLGAWWWTPIFATALIAAVTGFARILDRVSIMRQAPLAVGGSPR